MSHDYVVVGGGTAGSVLAARLSEDPSSRVLLLEAGSATPVPASLNPPDWYSLMHGSSDAGALTTVQSGTGTALHLARGRGLGGSSGINAMLFARGHHVSYADWSQFGGKGWNFEELLPYFMRSETAAHGDPMLRGTQGPLLVGPADPPSDVLMACLDGAIERGYSRARDISGGLDIGFGPADLTIVDGCRQSAADAYLRPVLGRANLEVITDANVQRVVVANGRAVGVEYLSPTGELVTARAEREVVLAAGGIGSPQLLLLSGIGPKQHLREVGVDVVVDLPGVGANLQDHPLTGVIYRSAKPIPAPLYNRGEIIGLLSTSGASAPDLQLIFVDTAEVTGARFDMDTYLIGVSPMQPHSRGSVRLAGPTADSPPVVDPNYLGDDRDMRTVLDGLRIAKEIGESRSLAAWLGEELAPGPAAVDEDALRAYVRATVSPYYHPVGTCALGETADAVVDSTLRVHGVEGLRVVDASVMPSLPSNNTLATVYAIAERGAELLRS